MSDPTPIRAQAPVRWFRGLGVWSLTDALLSWTEDERLRLESVGRDGAAGELVFDAPIHELGIAPAPGQLYVQVNGRRHRVEFSAKPRQNLVTGVAVGGLIGAAVANRISSGDEKDGGAGSWGGALLQAGAKRVGTSPAWSRVILFVVVPIVFVATFLGLTLLNR